MDAMVAADVVVKAASMIYHGYPIAVAVGKAVYQVLFPPAAPSSPKADQKTPAQLLEELGTTSDEEIGAIAESKGQEAQISPEQRQELAELVRRLVRGTRFHTTHGVPLTSLTNCKELVEEILKSLKPMRQRGEPAGPGHIEWKLERFLGMGSFGEVWLAHNPMVPTRWAFKFFTSDKGQEWLKRECQTLYMIQKRLQDHPNIIQYHNVVLSGVKYPFLVLEYLDGGSLEDWIVQRPEARRPLRIFDVMRGIAAGLKEAHNIGVSHRDLKPGNVLLTGGLDPIPKIADFGLGKVETIGGVGSGITSSMAVVGTNMYLPPEASHPLKPRQATQDDVFAFGVMWYQMLVGRLERPPYDFAEHLRDSGTDSWTIHLLSRCLAKPERRFGNAAELFAALNELRASPDWTTPADCYDVGFLAAEYLNSRA